MDQLPPQQQQQEEELDFFSYPQRQQQQQRYSKEPGETPIAVATKRQPLAIHPPPLPTLPPPPSQYETKPRRSSSISSQTSSVFSQNGYSSSTFFPTSPLFRSNYNKLGGSTVGMGPIVGSMPGSVGVGSAFSSYLGQQSPYSSGTGRIGFSASTLSLLSSHPSSPGVVSNSPFFTTESRMPFDMDAIDMSESEGEQDVAVDGFNGSIDGMDDDGSSSSGSDEEIEDRDNALSKDDGSFRSNKDSDVEHKNSFSVESPVSIYEPTPLASMLPSPVPSPRVMNHRAKVLRHDQQNENGDILRQLQEGKQCQPRPLQESILAQNQSLDIVDERESSKVSSQISDNYDNDVASLGSSVPSPVLTHSTPILSAQSTSPSSTSLSISPFPLESNMMLDSHLPKASSSIIDTPSIPSNLHSANIASNYHNIPLIPQDQEENSRLYTTVATNDDLFDEGMFEDEDSHSDQNNYNNSKVQEKDLQGTIEMETHSDLYGSLPQYTTHPTTATAATTVALVQQHQHRQEPDQTATASISDVVVAELKEVQSMLHDLHRRMDRLEQSLHDSQSTQNQTSPAVQKDGIVSFIKGILTPRRGGGGGGRRFVRLVLLILFCGLIVFGRREARRKIQSLLLTRRNCIVMARQLTRSRLGYLERQISRLL